MDIRWKNILGDIILGDIMEFLFVLFGYLAFQGLLTGTCVSFPELYCSVSLTGFFVLFGALLLKKENRTKGLLGGMSAYIIIVLALPILLGHMVAGPSDMEQDIVAPYQQITITSKSLGGIHYSMELHSPAFDSDVHPTCDYVSETIAPDSLAKDGALQNGNVELKLVAIVDKYKTSNALWNKFASWLTDRREVFVDVIKGNQKTTIEMSASSYSTITGHIKFATEHTTRLAQEDKEKAQSEKSTFQKDLENAKKI